MAPEGSQGLNRRDFLRLLLVSSGSLALSPLLKACQGATGVVPSTLTPPAAGVIVGVASPGVLAGLKGLDIDAFFEQAYRRWLVRDPENLTVLGLADSYGVGDANLTDISDAFIRVTQSLESGTLTLLRAYKRLSFSATQARGGAAEFQTLGMNLASCS